MPSFARWQWDRAFHQCPAGFVNHLLDCSVVNIHSCVQPIPSFLDTFTPAVSFSANQKDSVPGSPTHYNLARNPIHCILIPSTLGFAPATWSDIWPRSESASVEHLNLALGFGGSVSESCVVHWVLRLNCDLSCFIDIVYYQNHRSF